MAYTKTNWVNGTTPLNDKNMNKIENALENLDTNISKSTDEYSSTSTYSIGELVIYNNKLYKANQDITTAEAFNSSHWTEVTLLSDVNEIKSVVNNNADNLNKMDEGIKDLETEIDKKINILENGTYQNCIVCLAESEWSGIVPLPNADEYNITINSLSINQVQYSIAEVINVTKMGFQCLLTSKVAKTDYGIINYTIVHK